jgi:hypothetical protein
MIENDETPEQKLQREKDAARQEQAEIEDPRGRPVRRKLEREDPLVVRFLKT